LPEVTVLYATGRRSPTRGNHRHAVFVVQGEVTAACATRANRSFAVMRRECGLRPDERPQQIETGAFDHWYRF
jgi:hypothetical protein